MAMARKDFEARHGVYAGLLTCQHQRGHGLLKIFISMNENIFCFYLCHHWLLLEAKNCSVAMISEKMSTAKGVHEGFHCADTGQ
jgi:hypothetical protein